MVKAYLRYEAAASFGVIASLESNITYDSSGKHLLSPALEKVGVWNVRQGVCTRTLVPSSVVDHAVPVVTSVAASLSSLVAVGYSDGSIRIWDGEKGTCEVTFRGHEGAVTVLRYNKSGSLLASGSKKNDVMLWDVVGESGLFRLRGHRDQVTDLVFLDSDRKLISSSKDKFLRVWDLETQHCIQIVGGHHSEIWSLDVDPEERYLVTGSSDPELRFFTIKHERVAGDDLSYESGVVQNGDLSNKSKWEYVKSFGEIRRESKSRVATVRFNKSGTLLACQVAGKTVDVFRLLDAAEAKRKAKRRLHRKKEKKSKLGEMTEKVDDRPAIEEDGNALDVTVTDVFKLLQTVRSSKKITSIAFSPITSKNSVGTLALSSSKNLLEFYSVENNTAMKTIELQGHRSILRHVALSADNSLLMTVSHEAVKFWNPSSCSCLRTVETDSGMCGLLIPNNKYALVGTESGKMEIIDIGSGTCMEVVEAHGHFIHSIVAIPGENGFITTSEDHDVKFWEYQIKQRHGESSKHLVVSNVRTMKMNDAVLVAAVSPDGKYIGVAIESRVQVFFMDTLKPYLPLYGHSLRVLCMDISSDGDLIVTGSSDKTLRIWGLDFGNCHRIIRKAHDTSIAAVRFVHNTHYLFSAGWDGLVKYWDADKFQHLLTLEGHHAQVRCLAVSSRGDFVVTGSMDMSIRRWDRTEEPFFLEEEKEKRQMQEAGLESAFENNAASKEELPQEGAVALPGTKTEETITSTDLLIDALDVAEVELKRLAEHEEEKTKGIVVSFQPNLIMQGLSPSEYVLHALSSIHQSDLEQTLLALPFSDALKLLGYLRGWCFKHDKVELVSRVATVLLQIHHHQLITTSSARPVLTVIKDNLHARVKECKDTLGFNLAAMDHLKQLMASKSDAPFRNAKSKILEIRLRQSKRITAREDTKGEKQKKKKPKKSDGSHAWT